MKFLVCAQAESRRKFHGDEDYDLDELDEEDWRYEFDDSALFSRSKFYTK
jgi:hypothetical protein